MPRNYTLPEPGDNFIRVEDVEQAIEDYEATEENEQGEFEVPFDPELYIALKDLWTGGDAGHWHGLEDGNYEEMILESYFVEYITDLINQCYPGEKQQSSWPYCHMKMDYEMPGEKQQSSWPYCHMKMDYEAAAEEAKQDYTEVTFGGYTYYVR